MPTSTQLQQTEKLRSTLNSIVAVPNDALIQQAKLGDLNFADRTDAFDGVKRLCKELLESDLAHLPSEVITQLIGASANVHNTFQTIKSFSVSRENAPRDRNTYLSHLDSYWLALLKTAEG